MTIKTKPVFYFIDGITKDNNLLNFREPGNPPGLELTANIEVGSRSMTNLLSAIEKGLNSAGEETYTVTMDRNTRIITIAATDTFELLVASGSNIGQSPFSLLGFSGVDRTGASTYDSDSAIGNEYLPQFPPQKFKDFDNNKEGIQTSISESASGIIEVVTFGTKRMMEMELSFITNRTRVKNGPIDNNPTGLEDAREFMDFCITKSDLEFMRDRTARSTFDTVLLDKTKNKTGTSYELSEMNKRGFDEYYTTGKITFRRVE